MRTHLACLFLLVAASTGIAEAQRAPALVDSLGQRLVRGHPGAAVIGVLKSDTSSVHPFGTVDSTGHPPSARTLFEIGSVTKTFTGLLLAEGIERDRLRATDPVRQLVPDSVQWSLADSARRPGAESTMTLAHLATHRSGLPRLPSNLAAHGAPRDPYAAYDDHALFSFFDGYERPRAPGTRFEYSNLGMGLLGHLLARRADTSYAALVRRRIAEPLGLSDTRMVLSANQRARLAQGHTRAGAATSSWHFDALAGAGALRSTTADMLAYLRAHRAAARREANSAGAAALDRAMQRALRPRADTGQDNTRIGFAWYETTRDGHPIVWHNGSTGGFRSFVGFDRDTGRGAVVLVSAAISPQLLSQAAITLIEHRPE